MSTNYFLGCNRCHQYVDLAVRYAGGFVFGITSKQKPDEVEAVAGEFLMAHNDNAGSLRIFDEHADVDGWAEIPWGTEIEECSALSRLAPERAAGAVDLTFPAGVPRRMDPYRPAHGTPEWEVYERGYACALDDYTHAVIAARAPSMLDDDDDGPLDLSPDAVREALEAMSRAAKTLPAPPASHAEPTADELAEVYGGGAPAPSEAATPWKLIGAKERAANGKLGHLASQLVRGTYIEADQEECRLDGLALDTARRDLWAALDEGERRLASAPAAPAGASGHSSGSERLSRGGTTDETRGVTPPTSAGPSTALTEHAAPAGADAAQPWIDAVRDAWGLDEDAPVQPKDILRLRRTEPSPARADVEALVQAAVAVRDAEAKGFCVSLEVPGPIWDAFEDALSRVAGPRQETGDG